MQTAAILLGITAVGGLLMAIIRWRGAPRPPDWLAMLHGLLAAAGLTLLIHAGLTVGIPSTAWLALALFVVAALGGVYLNLRYHTKQIPLPKGIIIGHAVLGVAGYGLLLLALNGA